MPPIGDVDTTTPPPDPGDVSLGSDGPPLPPDVPPVDPSADPGSFNPVPDMGGDTGGAGVDAPMDDPLVGGDVDLRGGAPMPPIGDVDTTTPPPRDVDLPADQTLAPPPPPPDDGLPPGDPTAVPHPGVPEDQDPTLMPPVDLGEDQPAETTPDPQVLLSGIEPGTERTAAAAVAGVVLDHFGYPEAEQRAFVDLLEEAATDGTITQDEFDRAMLDSGLERTLAPDPSPGGVVDILNSAPPGGQVAFVNIHDESTSITENTSIYSVEVVDDEVHFRSPRTGATYAATPDEVSRVWRECGATVFAPPPVPAVDPAAAPIAATEPVEEGGDGMRNALIAGAILLPLAGAGTYLVTRKIR